MQSAGLEFPPRVENSLSWFTPPPTHHLPHSTSPYEEEVDILALETDPSGLRYVLSLIDIDCTKDDRLFYFLV